MFMDVVDSCYFPVSLSQIILFMNITKRYQKSVCVLVSLCNYRFKFRMLCVKYFDIVTARTAQVGYGNFPTRPTV